MSEPLADEIFRAAGFMDKVADIRQFTSIATDVRRLERENAALRAALRNLVDIVDPDGASKKKYGKIEPYFVEPLAEARKVLA